MFGKLEQQYQRMEKWNDRVLQHLEGREKRLEKRIKDLTKDNRELYVGG